MANDPLADAKKFLADSKAKFQPLSPSAAPVAPPKAAPKPASDPGVDKELAAKKQMVDKAKEALKAPTMHDGGKVKKDGLHNLQKGEVVVPKDKVMNDKSGIIDGLMEDAKEKAEPKDGKKEEKKSEKKSSAKNKRPKHTHIDHHPNGSHTLTFHHQSDKEGGPDEMTSQAVPDDAGMQDAVQSAMSGGEPAPGEAAEAAPAAPAAAGPAAAA